MKKRLCIILSIIIVITSISAVCFNIFAATSGVTGNLNWELDTDTGVLTIGGYGYGDNYNSYLDQPWYTNRRNIKTVVAKNGVQALGDNAFYGCSNIEKVYLPDTMIKIGDSCFRGCTSLKGIEIPNNCCELYGNIFYGCTSLKWAILPDDSSAQSYSHKIPDKTFYGCTALEQVFAGTGYTSIGSNAFYRCTYLKTLVWTSGTVNSVGNNAFTNVSAKVTFVGDEQMRNWCLSNNYNYLEHSGTCGSSTNYNYDFESKELNISGTGNVDTNPWSKYSYLIKNIDIDGLTGENVRICENAFENCQESGSELILNENITNLGANSFYNCGYQFVTIKANNIQMGEYVFDRTKKITFYGNHDSGAYDFVLQYRQNSDTWKYYCINNNHHFPAEPLEDEEDIYCDYCDKIYGKNSVSENDGHKYEYRAKGDDDMLYYSCSECGIVDHTENIDDVISDFEFAVSTGGDAYNQINYDGRFDILRDGYINAKDYSILLHIKNGIYTGYEMLLNNTNATKNAKSLYKYISGINGNSILTGQQESTWMGDNYEFNYIQQKTGKLPAIRGFDFMNDDFDGVVSRAEQWHNNGGIVSICWHCSAAFDQSYDACKNDELTAEQWEAILTNGTAENAEIIRAMDKAGNALMQLQSKEIPVLWRPFHEFDGGWFWWGKGGSEYFKRLWIMMYDHYTNDLHLNNLIWVLGYCHNGTDYGTNLADWYPGNQYCDIVGADSYEVEENGAEQRLYAPIKPLCNGTKPMAMHETGKIPTEAQFKKVPWCWFLTWHTEYLTDTNSDEELYAIYNSDRAITLDELPDLYQE